MPKMEIANAQNGNSYFPKWKQYILCSKMGLFPKMEGANAQNGNSYFPKWK